MFNITKDNKLLNATFKVVKNKYFIALSIFVVYLIVLSQNNLITKFDYIKNLHKLKKEREYYKKEIINITDKLYEIRSEKDNIANIEKFAREQYLMKKDNEDIYIIIEKPKE